MCVHKMYTYLQLYLVYQDTYVSSVYSIYDILNRTACKIQQHLVLTMKMLMYIFWYKQKHWTNSN